MSRITAVDLSTLPEEQRAALKQAEQFMGFMPNDALVMARNPVLMSAFGNLVAAIYAPGQVDAGLKRLIGLMSSVGAGCTYCMGHTAFASERNGVEAEKLAEVWDFENSDQFSDAERAALRVALHAGQTPSAVTDDMFAELAGHFDDDAQMEIVSVIAMFGFLNRWNSTLATELEALPGAALQKLETSNG